MTNFPLHLLALLRDPDTGARLVPVVFAQRHGGVAAGLLVSPTNAYPIHEGIPRFVFSGQTLADFGTRWQSQLAELQATDERVQRLLRTRPQITRTQAMYDFQWRTLELCDEEANRQQVLTYLGPPVYDRARVALEIGCGNGRHSCALSEYAACVLSLDFGDHVEVAAHRCAEDPRIAHVQASACALPLAGESVDVVFSTGVLMHTPDTRQAFMEAARVVAPDGMIACWVYPHWKHARLEEANEIVRRMTHWLPWRVVLAGAYLFAWALPLASRLLSYRFQHPHLRYRDAVYYLFDWFTPRYQWKHTNAELADWCREAGLTVQELLDPPAGVRARRPARLIRQAVQQGEATSHRPRLLVPIT